MAYRRLLQLLWIPPDYTIAIAISSHENKAWWGLHKCIQCYIHSSLLHAHGVHQYNIITVYKNNRADLGVSETHEIYRTFRLFSENYYNYVYFEVEK